MKIDNLPGNLNEAIDYFEQSDWIKEVLGTEFCKEYAAAKKKEWLRYTREISSKGVSNSFTSTYTSTGSLSIYQLISRP